MVQTGRHVTLPAKGMWEKCVWKYGGNVFHYCFLCLSLSQESHWEVHFLFRTLPSPKYRPRTGTTMRKRPPYGVRQWQENFREELDPEVKANPRLLFVRTNSYSFGWSLFVLGCFLLKPKIILIENPFPLYLNAFN